MSTTKEAMIAAAPIFRRGCRGPIRVLAARRLYSSASETVPLAYDLHAPAKPVSDKESAPILFLHGLFGSKKNNRSISK